MYQAGCETLFSLRDLDVRDRINVLRCVVTDVHARKQRGETEANDIWKEYLDPLAAVCARTTPS